MKERILSQLYGISTSHPDSESYFGIISKHFPTLSGEEIRRRAGTALGMMLSDYNRFRVETIDAFFELSRMEGIIPAIESAHAVAHAMKIAPTMDKDDIIMICLSGRGDKDVRSIAEYRGVELNE